MTGLKNLFCEHPESVNETYAEHFAYASGFGVKMIVAGLACVMHGMFPFMFKRTGSKAICELHERLSHGGRPTSTGEIEADRVAQN